LISAQNHSVNVDKEETAMLLRPRSGSLAICLACGLLAASAQLTQAQNLTPAATPDAVALINAQAFQALIASNKPIFILDVRQQDEYDAGHVDKAVLIPLNVLPDRYSELPKDKPIVVYCRSGARSARAVAFLRAQGFANAFSLSGGFMGWTEFQAARK
jgi:rhodanese-related sulfurtransferase